METRPRPEPAVHDVFLSSAWHGVDTIRADLAAWLEKSGYSSFVFERFKERHEWKALAPAAREAICLENVGRSRLYVGIFRERYGSSGDDHLADVAFTDFEFYEAFRARIPMRLYHLADGTPEPKLTALLTLVDAVAPGTLVRVTSEVDLKARIERDIDVCFNRREPIVVPPSRLDRYTRALIVHRKPDDDRNDGIRFMLDRFPAPSLPFDPDLVRAELHAIGALASYEAQLNAAWRVFQRLFHVPWRQTPASLDLWDEALGVWEKAAAWYGLHGFAYTGRIAADNTLVAVRVLRASAGELASLGDLVRKGETHTGTRAEWISLYSTGGALASGYYSVAKKAPRSLRLHFLKKADGWISVAERAFAREPNPGMEAGFASIRGHIFLQWGRRPEAISLLERSLYLREEAGLDAASVAEAQVDLGHAYFLDGARGRGERLIEDGLAAFAQHGSPGMLARARRKAAVVYARGLSFRRALNELVEVRDLVEAHGLKDQGREGRWMSRVPRFVIDRLRLESPTAGRPGGGLQKK